MDEVFTRTDSAGPRHFLSDALGSTLALTDPTCTLQTQYSYEPFGNSTATGPVSSNTFQYTGRENDATGLYYYRARYYSPTFQRFISEDPVGFGGGDANLYAYTRSSPTNFTDPSGNFIPYWHYRITEWAARNAGWSPEAAAALAKKVADVDNLPHSQDPDAKDANQHPMSGRKSNAKQQSCRQAFDANRDQFASDMQSDSMDDLAKALHMIQDAWAPPHAGFPPWNGGWTRFHIPGPSVL